MTSDYSRLSDNDKYYHVVAKKAIRPFRLLKLINYFLLNNYKYSLQALYSSFYKVHS